MLYSWTQIKIKNPSDIKNKYSLFIIIILEFKKEIIQQEKNFIKNGGKFIIPFPSPKILTK